MLISTFIVKQAKETSATLITGQAQSCQETLFSAAVASVTTHSSYWQEQEDVILS
jgi:hypothetical protein